MGNCKTEALWASLKASDCPLLSIGMGWGALDPGYCFVEFPCVPIWVEISTEGNAM